MRFLTQKTSILDHNLIFGGPFDVPTGKTLSSSDPRVIIAFGFNGQFNLLPIMKSFPKSGNCFSVFGRKLVN